MDDKVSKESFKTYRDWQRYILRTKPKLSDGCRRPTLLLYCFAMASHGTNGLGCYTSDAKIAGEIGMYEAKRVRPYRHEALRLGWFVSTGEHKGRAEIIDIAIPADAEMSTVVDVPTVTNAKHDGSKIFADCPGCVPYLDDVSGGKMEARELARIHTESWQQDRPLYGPDYDDLDDDV